MSVYVFSQAIGHTTDSIDYMRIYKEQMLGETSASIKYIFPEIPEQKWINRYTKAGIDAGQLVSMYQYLTDNHTLKPSIKTEKKLDELKNSLHYTGIIHLESEIRLVKDGYVIATILLDEKDKEYVWGICYFSYTKLIRMEVYTDRIIYSNSYITAISKNGCYAKLVRRTFYNSDASVAYDQVFEGEEETFLFPDGKVYKRLQFVTEFIKRLDLLEQDTVLLDYSVPNKFIQAIFEFGKRASIVAMAPAKYDFAEDKDYYYWFQYSEALDFMIVSTKGQKEMLTKELKKYYCSIPDIRVIPIEGEFLTAVLYESYNENLALSWTFNGKTDGFLIYDEYGTKLCETRNIYQHYFLIKGYQKETGFVLKAFSDTVKGKVIIAESKIIRLCMRRFDKPVVSLVIPAYNAEEGIARAIDNALAQSFLKLEIIIVDDGSTDFTSNIIEWYAEKYSNVSAIHQENSGVSAARNRGIETAQGDFIGFMDSDDMIHPDMIIRLYYSIIRNKCEIAVTSAYTVTNAGYIKYLQYALKEDVAMTTDEFFVAYMRNDLGLVVWNKLYNASLVKTHMFPIFPYEDLAWTPYVLSYADKICYLNDFSYDWDRSIGDNTLSGELMRYTKKETFKMLKQAILFYLEEGNPKRCKLLKKVAKNDLLRCKKKTKYEEYGKLWEWVDEQF